MASLVGTSLQCTTNNTNASGKESTCQSRTSEAVAQAWEAAVLVTGMWAPSPGGRFHVLMRILLCLPGFLVGSRGSQPFHRKKNVHAHEKRCRAHIADFACNCRSQHLPPACGCTSHRCVCATQHLIHGVFPPTFGGCILRVGLQVA